MRALADVGFRFCIEGSFVSAQPWGNGHINDTFAAVYRGKGGESRYIHQRVNTSVFKAPAAMMENIERVTRHLEAKGDSWLRPLKLIRARDGAAYWENAELGFWRTFEFVEGARSVEVVETPAQVREAARAFGEFQRLLIDLPGPRLRETIPGFHDTPARFKALDVALAADTQGRASQAKPEIEFALRRREGAGRLEELKSRGEMPERMVHNDTKINNVLLDESSGRGLCVIDLDTVMPGFSVIDFGDLVRTSVSPAPEDERDLSKIALRLPIFEALAEGYLSTAGSFLTASERAHLVFGARLITLEVGVRFLTDYLSGDVYFKIHRPGHNLDRCRAQFRLVELLEQAEDNLQQAVARV